MELRHGRLARHSFYEFVNVGARHESTACTDDYQRLNGRIGLRIFDGARYRFRNTLAERIHGRIIDPDHSNSRVDVETYRFAHV